MRTVLWLSFVSLMASGAFGQRAAGPGAVHGANPSSQPSRPLPPRRIGPGFGAFPALPGYIDNYDSGYTPASYQAPPPAAPPVVVVEPPPPVVRSEIHEYNQVAANQNEQEPPAYALVLRDGTVHSAVAVVVQKNGLLYVDPDGRHEVVALDAVDRETTRKLNQERKLRLQLPYPLK